MKINRQNHRVLDGTVILFFYGNFCKQQSERKHKMLDYFRRNTARGRKIAT